MKRKLSWLALVVALAAPAAMAWAAEGAAGDEAAETAEHPCCCCHKTACPR